MQYFYWGLVDFYLAIQFPQTRNWKFQQKNIKWLHTAQLLKSKSPEALKSQISKYCLLTLVWLHFGTNWTQQGPEIDLDSVINPHYKVHNNSATKVWLVLKLLHNWMHFTSHFLALILLTDPKHLLDQIIEVRLSLIWKHVQTSVHM